MMQDSYAVKDSFHTLTSSLARFFSGTLFSRATGFCREVTMAAFFGVSPVVASFWVAFRLAHLFRRFFGEGGLHMAFIPHFESLRQEDPQKAFAFFYRLKVFLITLLIGLILLGELILGTLLFSFSLSPKMFELIHYTMLLLPILVFISLYALNAALLNCHQQFFLSAAAPALVNIFWVVALFFLKNFSQQEAIRILCLSLNLAFMFQWLVTLPHVLKLSKDFIPKDYSLKTFKKELFCIVKPFIYILFGVAATQINSALDALFATASDAKGPAVLWYAIRVQQIPIAFLGVGISTAVLPPLARFFHARDSKKFMEFFRFALTQTFLLICPITFLLWALAHPLVAVIYQRGAFDQLATEATLTTLKGYLLGLAPMVLLLVFASVFYAKKNYKTPVKMSMIAIITNVCLNTFFVFILKYQVASIAYATSIAAFVQVICLYKAFKKEFDMAQILQWKTLLKIVFAGFGALWVTQFFPMQLGYTHYLNLFLELSIKSVIFFSVYLTLAFLFKIENYFNFLNFFFKKQKN